jgi:hypothetical protein
MSIFRIQKDENNPYVIINKKFLEDKNISLKLKGFLAYCLSKPDNWKFHVRQLASVLKEGKDAIYSIIDEGIEHGYIERTPQRTGGKFMPVDYVIHESKIQKILTVSGNPDTETSDTETPTLLINDTRLNIEKEEEGGVPKRPPPLPPPKPPKKKKEVEEKVEVAPHVFLTPSQENALKTRLNGQNIELKDLYTKLSDWKIGKQNFGSKSDYLTIIRWVIDAVRADKNGSSKQNKENNIEFSKKIAEKFPEKIKSGDIYIGYKYVDFVFGQRVEQVGFEENGFREQCINCLRKMNLAIDGL